MDPASAIGIAAATLQFLTFSIDALKLCQQVRDSADGVTEANESLEAACHQMTEITNDLQKATSGSSQASRRIDKIASDCLASSNNLAGLLQDVRGASRSKPFNAARSTFRAMKSSRRIEKLRNNLDKKQKLLISALINDTWIRTNLIEATQSAGFDTLSEGVKKLARELQVNQTETSKISKAIESIPATIASQSGQTRGAVEIGTHAIKRDVAKLHTDVEVQFKRLKATEAKDELMETLFFPEHMYRRETVDQPWLRTFDWVLDGEFSVEDLEASPELEFRWSNFPQWLREGTSLYWIGGKAGSGKSTLLNHIIDAESTQSNLEVWADGKSLHMLSFFFWAAGLLLQRSVQGLLRSLLYQLLQLVPDAAEELLVRLAYPKGRIPTLSERKLKMMIQHTLESAAVRQRHVCIFIDGLDEFEGETSELLRLIEALNHHSHVKCCVSSRPEAQLANYLSSYEHLRLEELNYNDIAAYVTESLDVDELEINCRKSIGNTVITRAQGVFLWAVLVTRSIVYGARCGDDEQTLWERLQSVPSELESLFTKMFNDIDEFHRKKISFYISTLVLFHNRRLWGQAFGPNIALLTASKSSSDPLNYEDFLKCCEQTKVQTVAYSKGLLAVVDGKHNPRPRKHSSSMWAIPQDRETQKQSFAKDGAEWNATLSSRRAVPYSDVCQRLSVYESKRIEFVHRSVFDWIRKRAPVSDLPKTPYSDFTPNAEVLKALVNGWKRIFIAFPATDRYFCSEDDPTSLYRRLESTLDTLQNIVRQDPAFKECVGAIFSSVISLFSNGCTRELEASAKHFERSERVEEFVLREVPFKSGLSSCSGRDIMKLRVWLTCKDSDCFEYLRTKISEIMGYSCGPLLLSLMLEQRYYRFQHGEFEFVLDALHVLKSEFVKPVTNKVRRTNDVVNVLHLRGVLGTFHMSWNATTLEDTGVAESPKVITLAFLTLLHNYRYILKKGVQHHNHPLEERDSQNFLSMMESFVSLLDTWNVHIALREFPLEEVSNFAFGKGEIFPEFHEMMAEVSCGTILRLKLMPHLSTDDKLRLENALKYRPNGFRVVVNQGAMNDTTKIFHDLSDSAQGPFLSSANHDDRNIMKDFECQRALLKDVMTSTADEQRQCRFLAILRRSAERLAPTRTRPSISLKKKSRSTEDLLSLRAPRFDMKDYMPIYTAHGQRIEAIMRLPLRRFF